MIRLNYIPAKAGIRILAAALLAALALAPSEARAQRADTPARFEILSALQVSPVTTGGSDAQILALYRVDYDAPEDRPSFPISDAVYFDAGGVFAQPIAVRNSGWGHGVVSLRLDSPADSIAMRSKPGAFAAFAEDEYALPLSVSSATNWVLQQVLALESAADWPPSLREPDGQLTAEAYLYLRTAIPNLDTVAPGLRRLIVVPPRRTPDDTYAEGLEDAADFRGAMDDLAGSFGFEGSYMLGALFAIGAVVLAVVARAVTGTIEAAWVVAPLILVAGGLLGYIPLMYLMLAAAGLVIVIAFTLFLKREAS